MRNTKDSDQICTNLFMLIKEQHDIEAGIQLSSWTDARSNLSLS